MIHIHSVLVIVLLIASIPLVLCLKEICINSKYAVARKAEQDRRNTMSKTICVRYSNAITEILLSEVASYNYSIQYPKKQFSLLGCPTVYIEVKWDVPKLYKTISNVCGSDYDAVQLSRDLIVQHPESVSYIRMEKYRRRGA